MHVKGTIMTCVGPWSTVRRDCDKDPKQCEREYVCRSKNLGHFWEKAKKTGTVHNMFEEGQGLVTCSLFKINLSRFVLERRRKGLSQRCCNPRARGVRPCGEGGDQEADKQGEDTVVEKGPSYQDGSAQGGAVQVDPRLSPC